MLLLFAVSEPAELVDTAASAVADMAVHTSGSAEAARGTGPDVVAGGSALRDPDLAVEVLER